jgi:KDO2-lipid IV(A) lauroyltransferase
VANLFFRTLAALPLRWNHRVGSALGRLAYLLDQRYAKRLRENIASSRLAGDSEQLKHLIHINIHESGKAFSEVLIAWLRPPQEVAALVLECRGWEHVEAALRRGRGIIFVTPHLGCFDIAGRYLTGRLPIVFLYSPPRLKWAAKLMQQGRERMNATMAAPDRAGVRLLLKTLKQGGNICILPDQAPSQGEGVWADFFGRPAYTMTLIGRLQQATGADVLMFFGERLPKGAGYCVWIKPLAAPLAADQAMSARQINAAVEDLVRQCPTQYLWSYNRYKAPAGAPPRPGTTA